MTPKVDVETIIDLVDGFINENGMWFVFIEYLNDRGYTTKELGFSE